MMEWDLVDCTRDTLCQSNGVLKSSCYYHLSLFIGCTFSITNCFPCPSYPSIHQNKSMHGRFPLHCANMSYPWTTPSNLMKSISVDVVIELPCQSWHIVHLNKNMFQVVQGLARLVKTSVMSNVYDVLASNNSDIGAEICENNKYEGKGLNATKNVSFPEKH